MSENPLETPEQDVPAPAEAPETPTAPDAPVEDVPAPHYEVGQASVPTEPVEAPVEDEVVDPGPVPPVVEGSPEDVLDNSAKAALGEDATQADVDRYVVRNRNHLLPALASTFGVAEHAIEHLFNREV